MPCRLLRPQDYPGSSLGRSRRPSARMPSATGRVLHPGAVTWFRRPVDLAALRAELEDLDARISAHPLASPRIRAAHATVEEHGSGDAAVTDEALAAEGLPSVEELGRAQVSGTWSWWRLHRRRRHLEARIRRSVSG